mmetsp:Transcript_40264/g.77174  ORF Transcript_40264/g.77174 Transcript_40264/m.77174 type:complete len:104 (+) Transcript_40264:560-871(+)
MASTWTSARQALTCITLVSSSVDLSGDRASGSHLLEGLAARAVEFAKSSLWVHPTERRTMTCSQAASVAALQCVLTFVWCRAETTLDNFGFEQPLDYGMCHYP